MRKGWHKLNIKELLREDLMIMEVKTDSEEAVIDEMIERLHEKEILNDREKFKGEILKGERQETTGIGNGVAIPYAKTNAVLEPAVLFARSTEGIDFEAADEGLVHIFLMTACPDGSEAEYIHALTDLYNLLLIDGFVNRLLKAQTPEDIYLLVEWGLEGRLGAMGDMEPVENYPFVGIVVNYENDGEYALLAEEAIKEAAEDLNIAIKIESDSETGQKNRLTPSDIALALGIMIATDKRMDLERFDGKHLIKVPVADGIRQAETILTKIIQKDSMDSPDTDGEKDKGSIKERVTKQKEYIMENLPINFNTLISYIIFAVIIFSISTISMNLDGESPFFITMNTIGKRILQSLIPIGSGILATKFGKERAWFPGMIAGFFVVFLENGLMMFLGGLMGGAATGYIYILLEKLQERVPEKHEEVSMNILLPLLGIILVSFMMYIVFIPLLEGFQ